MSFKQILMNLYTGQDPKDYDLYQTPRIILINIVFTLVLVYSALFAILSFLENDILQGISDIVYVLIFSYLYFYLKKTKNYNFGGIIVALLLESIFFYFFWRAHNGNSGALWAYTLPLISIFIVGIKFGSMVSLTYILSVIFLYIFDNARLTDTYPLHFEIRYVTTYIAVYLFTVLVERVRAKTHSKIFEQNKILEKTLFDLKQTKETLQENIINYKALFEHASDGIAIVQDNMLKLVNPYLENLVGKKLKDLDDKSYLNFLHPDSRPKTIEIYKKRLAGKNVADTYEADFLSASGERIPVEIRGNFILFNKKPANLVFIRDIRGRRAAEKEKDNLQKQLQQAQKMEAIGQLAGGIAHDFNNMLGAISGYSDMIIKNFPDTDPKIKKYSKMILTASKRSADLTSKLLAFARKGSHEQLIVDMHDVISDTIKILESTIDKKIIIRQEFNATNNFVIGDCSQLQNIILNLAVNARDALLPDGGTMQFSTEDCIINDKDIKKFSFHVDTGEYLKIIVKDDGIGMERSTLDKMFEPFFTTKQQGKGTGLGLASVYGTVKAHKGFISVESKINKGTTIEILLPITTQKPMQKNDLSDKSVESGNETILIIDDEELIREMTSEILKDSGYTPIVCKDGNEGIDYYKSNYDNIDLVILDMVMPNKNGYECFLELKNINPKVRVLVASGYAINQDIRKTLEAGAIGFLQKPFDSSELTKKLKNVLSLN